MYVDLADWGITRSHGPNRFKLASGFLMNRVFGSRGSLDTRHDDGWGDICLVPSGNNHVGSFEETGDSGGVGVEETLLLNRNTIPAPVYLNKFWEFRLFECGFSVRLELRRLETATDTVGSIARTNAYWILHSKDQRLNHSKDSNYELTVRPKTLLRALPILHHQWTEL